MKLVLFLSLLFFASMLTGNINTSLYSNANTISNISLSLQSAYAEGNEKDKKERVTEDSDRTESDKR